MSEKKKHVPSGSANGLDGMSLCGRWEHYGTGDHDLIRRLALRPGAEEVYCSRCLRRLRELTKGIDEWGGPENTVERFEWEILGRPTRERWLAHKWRKR